MGIREKIEEWEKKSLSEFATLSVRTAGRKKDEPACPVRTEFQKDADRILHSLGFRLLKHKTQVFLSTTGEEFRTRLTHTLEVASVARYIAGGLNLNRDLVEAISLGHDLGHTPFGHTGEEILDSLTPFDFRHSHQSVRVVETIENNGRGLNLTKEVIDGIEGHSKGLSSLYDILDENVQGQGKTSTIEGEVVQFADWIAYINHDIDDAFNMGLITKDDLPPEPVKILGMNFQDRTVSMIKDVIEASRGKGHITMSEKIIGATDELRRYLYGNVYRKDEIISKEDTAKKIVTFLYERCVSDYGLVLKEMPFLAKERPERGACDYIAFLTDSRAQDLYAQYSR
ncbi:MAG: deoxyguanosinetriphosphate triphosphohydrolase [Elusimicrobia bacterium]|nr:deoxyguanosinetriphosphate triphosphohydrolase [Elusimicrobiota bacterium]